VLANHFICFLCTSNTIIIISSVTLLLQSGVTTFKQYCLFLWYHLKLGGFSRHCCKWCAGCVGERSWSSAFKFRLRCMLALLHYPNGIGLSAAVGSLLFAARTCLKFNNYSTHLTYIPKSSCIKIIFIQSCQRNSNKSHQIKECQQKKSRLRNHMNFLITRRIRFL